MNVYTVPKRIKPLLTTGTEAPELMVDINRENRKYFYGCWCRIVSRLLWQLWKKSGYYLTPTTSKQSRVLTILRIYKEIMGKFLRDIHMTYDIWNMYFIVVTSFIFCIFKIAEERRLSFYNSSSKSNSDLKKACPQTIKYSPNLKLLEPRIRQRAQYSYISTAIDTLMIPRHKMIIKKLCLF